MKQKTVKILLALLAFGCFSGIKAQQSVLAGGGVAQGSGGNSSFSVGQIIIDLYEGTNGTVSHGVQQPFEISVIVGIESSDEINLTCTAYPNPVVDKLVLEVTNDKFINLQMTLYNSAGLMLEQKKVKAEKTEIDMEHRAAGVYIMTVTSKQNEIKSFKIIKH